MNFPKRKDNQMGGSRHEQREQVGCAAGPEVTELCRGGPAGGQGMLQRRVRAAQRRLLAVLVDGGP